MGKLLKILAVEDRKNWCEVFEKLFIRSKYELCIIHDLDTADTILHDKRDFDVVVININLSSDKKNNRDGYILLLHIKDNYPRLPRIVLTGKPNFDPNVSDIMELIKKFGLETILSKSKNFDDDALIRAVNNAVADEEKEFMTEYSDFYLHIGPDGYIRAISGEGEDSDKISVSVPDDIQKILEETDKNITEKSKLKFLGQKLYDIAFPAKIHTLFSKTEAVAREKKQKIRIRLTIQPDTLASLPWEFVYRNEGGYFLSTNPKTVLSHYLDLSLPQNRVRTRNAPLDLLIIIANPQDQTPLNPDDWEKMIVSALYKPLSEGSIAIRTIKRATRKEIGKALLEHQPDIVHFIGHGIYDKGVGYLALVDDKTNNTWKVDDDQFAALFLGADDHLGLVCLATCESAKSDSPKGFLGIAPKIVQKGVPAVVAMRYSVLISTAEVFLEEFYNAIAARKPVDWAVQWARNQVALEKGLDNREFATPVLFMRAKDGNIFDNEHTKTEQNIPTVQKPLTEFIPLLKTFHITVHTERTAFCRTGSFLRHSVTA